MLENIDEIVRILKEETNNIDDIIYREKYIGKTKIYIIYNEPITSSDKISDFIIRSLNRLEDVPRKKLYASIKNNISNFKVKEISNYEDLCLNLHSGFTIIIMEGENKGFALETKASINRAVGEPSEENVVRGAKDAFVEDFQINIGLIKKRIRSNDLWMDKITIGKYTKTNVGVLYINKVAKKELIDEAKKRLNQIDIAGIVNSSTIKNLITNENTKLPTVITTERPDLVSKALLEGKIAIVVENSPFVLIIPAMLTDLFKSIEDEYGKSINVTSTRFIRAIAFFIALLTPAIYIALITYNQEMIPIDLLVSFATQRDGVPFPAFVEATMMLLSFEILRESDLRAPTFTGSSLSIVGALILGEAAVNAGIVSPIMIIIVAITSISSLPFSEIELTNTLRTYRILFMLGAIFMGIIGVVIIFLFFIIRASSIESFGKPYLMPYVPTNFTGLKKSIIRFPIKKLLKRESYLSNNEVSQRSHNNEE
ncbi:MAG: spore germination protein [Clostridium sp.]|nr:spore germination protein [Clostridium sp.]MCM1444511.1 spore germination protein [Candidatus Amulumruptor caecigallinarius]